jgi:integrase
VTNTTVQRKDVVGREEFLGMLQRVDDEEYPFPYYRLRDRAVLCLLRRTGKRRSEVAGLEVLDLEVKGKYLSVTFTVAKKRRGSIMSKRREKLLSLRDPWTRPILEYWEWMRTEQPGCRYLFPTTFYSPLSNSLRLSPDSHLSGRQLLRIVKRVNPEAWCHLFRETVGAEIVRRDPSIMSPFRVMRRLDLESYTTAFNYMKRFAADIIEHDEEDDVVVDES